VPGGSQERHEDCTDVTTVTRDEDSHLLLPDVVRRVLPVNWIHHGWVLILRARHDIAIKRKQKGASRITVTHRKLK
jgi:hypothetical protein